MLTTEAMPIIDAAQGLIRNHLDAYDLPLPDTRVNTLVDMVIRLVLTHVTTPGGTPEQTADDIAYIAQKVLQDGFSDGLSSALSGSWLALVQGVGGPMKFWAAGCAIALTAALTLAVLRRRSRRTRNPRQRRASGTPTTAPALADVAMARPGKFKPPLCSPDILVQSQDPFPASVVAKAKALKDVVATETFSLASFYAEQQSVVYAAVNPRTFRRFTPGSTATFQEIWDRIADGEIALTPELRRSLPLVNDYVTIGNDQGALRAHVGSYAELVSRSRIGALVNERWAERLGMLPGNAMLISTGNNNPDDVVKAVRKKVGKGTAVQRLALGLGRGSRPPS